MPSTSTAPLNIYSLSLCGCTTGFDSKVGEKWFDSGAVGAVTCKWLRAGAGTSKPTWPRQHKNGTAPRRTSSSVESETSGRLHWRTPSQRTAGPVVEVELESAQSVFWLFLGQIQNCIFLPAHLKNTEYSLLSHTYVLKSLLKVTNGDSIKEQPLVFNVNTSFTFLSKFIQKK